MPSNQFQVDLIKNRYHIFDVNVSKIDGYYPKKLLELVPMVNSIASERFLRFQLLLTVK